MESCNICCEDFNLSDNKEVSCQWCQFTACRSCCQTYILDQQKTVCMNNNKNQDGRPICQKIWTRKFVTENFPKRWVNKEWEAMNAKLQVEGEMALLPATMSVVENRKEIETMKEDVRRVDLQILELQRHKWAIKQQIAAGGSVSNAKAYTVSRKCPDQECHGFLSSEWQCGLCEKWTCPDCHVIKGASSDTQHTCNPDVRATAQLLDNDTRPCPRCSSLIHKIDGCDHMWCTQCHVSFSWDKGTIETSRHNPHYYEWQRQQGDVRRNFGDFECGRNLSDNGEEISRLINKLLGAKNYFRNFTDEDFEKMQVLRAEMLKVITMTSYLQIYRGVRFRTTPVPDNLENRVLYLNKRITDKQFASRVRATYKAHEKKKDISDVIQFHVQGVTDIIYRIFDFLKGTRIQGTSNYNKMGHHSAQRLFNMFSEVQHLTDYSNELLKQHAVTHGCKTWRIGYDNGYHMIIM